ncbi:MULTISPECIES: phage holin family protein [Arthrobacter]|uniref:Phage holin family protein n=1 Tax=Arthrobacter terricola TaxID=2547396 RepID=A0A4R5KB75_9MICC|nr:MULTISPECIES: phage holin family protein [Arthrobacter]MBT8162627.1 phage holin family protein [Arthrobacter sp. GN70]TDF92409.1 phage holin family protein [Arthrobacter terricola]
MTDSELPPTPAHLKAESTSLGDLLGEVTQDLSTLIRQEVELAKAELKQSATRAGRSAGMLGGAGVAGHFVLLFLSLALWYALGELIGLGWSAVVVAVLWAIIAAALAIKGRSELKSVKGFPRTVETIQEIPETLKPREEQR